MDICNLGVGGTKQDDRFLDGVQQLCLEQLEGVFINFPFVINAVSTRNDNAVQANTPISQVSLMLSFYSQI